MRSMDSSLTNKMKSTAEMMFDLKSEMAMKQLTIDSMIKQIGDIKGDMSDHQAQLRQLGTDLAACQQKVTKIDRAQAS